MSLILELLATLAASLFTDAAIYRNIRSLRKN